MCFESEEDLSADKTLVEVCKWSLKLNKDKNKVMVLGGEERSVWMRGKWNIFQSMGFALEL